MAKPARDQLLTLPLAERIELVEDLWDSIAADAESVPVPESHRRELARLFLDNTAEQNSNILPL